MRTERLLAIILLALLALVNIVSLGQAEQSSAQLASVSIQGRVEYGYVLLFARIEFSEPVTSFSLNTSGLGHEILLAVAKLGGEQANGRVSNNILTFELPRRAKEVNLTLVVDAVAVNETTFTVITPIPLAPLGVVTKVEGSFTLGAAFSINTSLGNFSQGVVKYNFTAAPGACDIVRAWAPLSNVQMTKVKFLNRTILLLPDKVVYVDSLHLVSEAGAPVSSIQLTLPSSFKLEGVEASLFTYPSRYVSQYPAGNATLLIISLLPAMQEVGQVSLLTLRYSSPLSEKIDAYMGIGPFVTNYSVRICIEGTATLTPGALSVEKVSPSMQCYILPNIGPLLQAGMYAPVSVTPSFAQQSRSFLPFLGLIVAAVMVGAAGYLALRQGKLRERPALEAERAAIGSAEKIKELLDNRRSNLSSLVRQLREYRARGVGTAKVISLVNSHMQRDSALSSEVRKLLASLGPKGEKALSALAAIDGDLEQCVADLIETERLFRRGRLTKQEYKNQVEKLENKVLKLADDLGKVQRQLEF